jgi:hypothetical protein
MHEQRMKDVKDELDERIARALERVPEVTIPAGFAARVAEQVPTRREMAARPARFGWMTMRISMAVLVIALIVVAMLAGGRNSALGIALEWVLCAELAGLAIWLSGAWNFFTHEA